MRKNKYLYRQISEDLINKIQKGELKSGDCLPQGEKLAEEYGVSAITVTHALNNLKDEGYIVRIKGKGSFIKVPEAILNQEERKDEAPWAVRHKTKGKIGVVFEHISSCFGLDLLYKLDECVNEAGYKLLIRFSYGDRDRETEEIRFLKSEGVLGLIVMPCHGTYYNVELLKQIVEGMPVVLIDKQMEGVPVSSVCTDNDRAMADLVEYLAEKGKKKIGFIRTDEKGTTSVEQRARGFFKAVKKLNLVKMQECCLPAGNKMTEIYSDQFNSQWTEHIKNYLEEQKEMDGLVCSEYGIARCMNSLRKVTEARGIGICCIDEDYLAVQGSCFTHVRQDEKAIAVKCAELLIQNIEGNPDYRQGDYLIPGILRKV